MKEVWHLCLKKPAERKWSLYACQSQWKRSGLCPCQCQQRRCGLSVCLTQNVGMAYSCQCHKEAWHTHRIVTLGSRTFTMNKNNECHVLPALVWVSSKFFGFLPPPWTEDFKLLLGVNECVSVSSVNTLNPTVTHTLSNKNKNTNITTNLKTHNNIRQDSVRWIYLCLFDENK